MSGYWKPSTVSTHFNQNNEDDNCVSVKASYSASHGPLAQQRMMLPIYKHKKQILYAVEHFSVVVIVGETGSGKSTQIPQYLVDSGWADNDFSVVVTQPRRVAAITLAQRVAQESLTKVGEKVGYTVRFDDQSSPHTQIKYVTDGTLLREATLTDPMLSKYSVVMVDEAHERNLNSDAVLGLLKKLRRKRKNNLRIIICSATIDAPVFLNFFIKQKNNNLDIPGDNIFESGTIISVDGRQHVVDILYLDQPAPDYIKASVNTVLQICVTEKKGGDILCFLPFGEDVDNAIRLAEEELDNGRYEQLRLKIDLLPLYSTLPVHMQARVFQQQSSVLSSTSSVVQSKQQSLSARRVVFATNIAETSVTIPNISYVIDSGLVKLPYFDPRTGLERLIVGAISQASAQQRTGRAGRVQSGKCYRLYTEQFFLGQMKLQTPPEILRTNLTGFILNLKALGVDNILAFDLLDVPSVDALAHGLESLYALGAIDDKTQLTNLGKDLSCFPTEPRISRMLLESLSAGCSWEVLGVASALQVRDLFHRPHNGSRPQQQLDYQTALAEFVDPSGDHVTWANLLAEVDDHQYSHDECKERFINYVALQRALEVRKQLATFLRQFGRVQATGLAGGDVDVDQVRSKAIRRCVTAGYFFNVAKLSNDGRYYTLRSNLPVTPAPNSVLNTTSRFTTSTTKSRTKVVGCPEYIIFGETHDGPRGGIELQAVSAIEARWLRELTPHYWE